MSNPTQGQTNRHDGNEEPVTCQLQEKPLRLAPDGNAILIVLDASGKAIKRFSVSADILSLASPYFDRLFHGHMTEARDLSKLGSVSIDLNEDDPQAVEFILRVLHHKVPDSLATLDLQLIANIALHADKYDTCTILRPWVAYWLDSLEPLDKTPVGIGLRLLAAYMVRARPNFALVSSIALRNLPKDFGSSWSHHELLQHFPDAKINQLFERIEVLIQKSRQLIEDAEATLRKNSAIYEMDYMECSLCARRHPLGAKKCHPCKNVELRRLYCTCEARVSDYMDVLRRVELWGSSVALESLAASEIQYRISCAREDVKHYCEASLGCPLRTQIGAVATSLQRLLDDCRGPSLED
ncbi:hypothetical protein Q7P37_000235 [Cladosporium fusiforme]